VRLQRLFTVDEANALLPRVRELLEELRAALAALREAKESLDPAAVPDVSGTCSDRVVPPPYFAAVQRVVAAGDRFGEEGVHVKDVDEGLIDFPAISRGEPVLLCWREGEDRVAWFHDLSSGFAGRRPIGELED
jgi:hypothetical protein